jgi:hypothetical protein
VTRLTAVICALLSTSVLTVAEPPGDRSGRLENVRRGMSVNEVKQVLGNPQRVTRVVLFRRYLEQWHYDERAGYVEFACPRGEETYVLSVHSDPMSHMP